MRDGVGADISTTSSTTQLSANWDAATDAESGISGYQYAIGTTRRRHANRQLDLAGQCNDSHQDRIDAERGPDLLFQRPSRQRCRTDRQRHEFQRPDRGVGQHRRCTSQDNFENWTVHGGAWSSVNGESSTHTLDTSTDYAMAGSKCLKITDSDTTATTGASLTKNFSPGHLRRHLCPVLHVPAHRLWIGQFDLLTKGRTRVHQHQQLHRDHAYGR